VRVDMDDVDVGSASSARACGACNGGGARTSLCRGEPGKMGDKTGSEGGSDSSRKRKKNPLAVKKVGGLYGGDGVTCLRGTRGDGSNTLYGWLLAVHQQMQCHLLISPQKRRRKKGKWLWIVGQTEVVTYDISTSESHARISASFLRSGAMHTDGPVYLAIRSRLVWTRMLLRLRIFCILF
jgi:hypothetical protein